MGNTIKERAKNVAQRNVDLGSVDADNEDWFAQQLLDFAQKQVNCVQQPVMNCKKCKLAEYGRIHINSVITDAFDMLTELKLKVQDTDDRLTKRFVNTNILETEKLIQDIKTLVK